MAYERRSQFIGDHLGINIRRASYSGIRPGDFTRVGTTIVGIVQSLGCPVVSAPVTQHPDESDSQSFRDLLGSDVHFLDKGEAIRTPMELIDQLRRCRMVIAGSYHAGVFSLAQGVSVIGLAGNAYYKQKFEGLAHLFGVGCEVINVNEDGFQEKLRSAALRTWKMAEAVRPQLLSRAAAQVRASRAAYEALSQKAYSRIATASR